jgi:hypothetical protein
MGRDGEGGEWEVVGVIESALKRNNQYYEIRKHQCAPQHRSSGSMLA